MTETAVEGTHDRTLPVMPNQPGFGRQDSMVLRKLDVAMVAMLVGVPSMAVASPFWIIEVDAEKGSFVDIPTIDSMFGMPTIWIYRVLPPSAPEAARGVKYMSNLTQFDCKQRRFRSLAAISYLDGMRADMSGPEVGETDWETFVTSPTMKRVALNLCFGINFRGEVAYDKGVDVKDCIPKVEAQIAENAERGHQR